MRLRTGCLTIPRVVLLLLWLFDYTEPAYESQGRGWVLVLGLIFAPLTTLAYALVVHFGYDATEWWPAVIIAAALFDLGLLDRVFGRGRDRDKRKD